MAVAARNLYDPAKFAENLNLPFAISGKNSPKPLFPVVRSVHCYQMTHASAGAMTSPQYWAVEYHSKFAGEIALPNGERYEREKESVHLYAPNCEYREDTSEADFPIRETYMTFFHGEAADLRSIVGDDGFAIFLHASSVGAVMMKTVEQCHSRGQEALMAAQSGLLAIVDMLRRARPRSKNRYVIDPAFEKRRSFSDEVDDFLRRRLNAKISNADIARYMKVSESTLSHRYKRENGTSPTAKLLELRVDFAKTLLIKGEPLKIIADLTGFSDEFHLSKTFKKITGQSPRDFRKDFSYGA